MYKNDSQYLVFIGSIYRWVTAKIPRCFRHWLPLQQQNSWWKTRKVVGFGWNNIGDDGDVQQTVLVRETSEVWFVKVA